jgi:guanylate kinase
MQDFGVAFDATTPLARRADASLSRYMHPSSVLLVVSGPSGVGKDSVVRRLRRSGHPFHFVVTMTDRPPRRGEVEGEDYGFVSTAAFEEMIARGEFLEYARVYDQYKGVPRSGVQRAMQSGQDMLMRLDVQGAATIRGRVPQATTVFLAPPSLDVLVQRLRRRAGDTAEQASERLHTALLEMERIQEFDYVVVNHEGALDEAVAQVLAIVTAERCRTGREPVRL